MAFVYKAISFPFRRGATEFPQSASDAALIKESLVQIVMTGAGERVMRPKFGTSVLAHLFENKNADLALLIRREIATAIAAYEPRVRVINIQVTSSDEGEVEVTISYIVVTTNENQTVTLTLGTV